MPKVGYKHTDAAKKKMSTFQKGRKASDVARKNMSAAAKGKKKSDAHKKNIGAAHKGKKVSDATRKKQSDAHKGKPALNKGIPMSDAQKRKISDGHKGKKHTDATKELMSAAHKGKKPTETSREKMSAAQQGIPYDEWESFACEKKYCPKFDDACREACRAKYGHECFVCGLPQSENKTKNGKVRKLSVHHVDMDKAQGCESNWKLVPLCMHHHATAHNDELIARLGYLIKADIKTLLKRE